MRAAARGAVRRQRQPVSSSPCSSVHESAGAPRPAAAPAAAAAGAGAAGAAPSPSAPARRTAPPIPPSTSQLLRLAQLIRSLSPTSPSSTRTTAGSTSDLQRLVASLHLASLPRHPPHDITAPAALALASSLAPSERYVWRTPATVASHTLSRALYLRPSLSLSPRPCLWI